MYFDCVGQTPDQAGLLVVGWLSRRLGRGLLHGVHDGHDDGLPRSGALPPGLPQIRGRRRSLGFARSWLPRLLPVSLRRLPIAVASGHRHGRYGHAGRARDRAVGFEEPLHQVHLLPGRHTLDCYPSELPWSIAIDLFVNQRGNVGVLDVSIESPYRPRHRERVATPKRVVAMSIPNPSHRVVPKVLVGADLI